MTAFEALIALNAELLNQGVRVLERVGSELYAKSYPELQLSGPGAHMRHLLDFYSQLLGGLGTGQVDYDARQRDPRVETEPTYAAERMGDLIERLQALPTVGFDLSQTLHIKSDSKGTCPEDTAWTQSSFERELQAVMSHTVHHYALIAVALRLGDFDPGVEFGVAPSTLRYWQEQRECAQ